MTAFAPDPATLAERARTMVRTGRISAARPLVAALNRLAPGSASAIELEARLLLHDGRLRDAETVLAKALAAEPAEVSLLLCRAELRLHSGEALGAADDAAAAVIASPRHPIAKTLLGVSLLQLDRNEDAALCLNEAVAALPRHPGCREALSHALERTGRWQDALATLTEGIALLPGSVELRVAAIMTAMRHRMHAEAADLAEAARRDGIADARVFGLLGHALSLLGRNAAWAYEEALRLAPEDAHLRHLVAASGAREPDPRAPAAYVATIYDDVAESFDADMIAQDYRVPDLLRDAVLAQSPDLAAGRAVGPVLDLGCGTGLIGVACADLSFADLVGVDLSSRMIQRARATTAYSALRQEDIEAALGPGRTPAAAEGWAVILAGDSLCYFGNLEGVMNGAFMALRPGGLFAFSVEALEAPQDDNPPPWRLGPHGRFAHREPVLATLASAAGFDIRSCRRETIRRETIGRGWGAAVDGLIMVLARPS